MKQRWWMVGAVVPAVGVALAAVHGCAGLKSAEDLSPDAASTTDSPTADTCGHRRPPPRPTFTDPGPDLDLRFAVQTQRLGTIQGPDGGSAAPNVGLDLDDTCTGEGQGSSCAEPTWANANHKDGPDGIDNAAGEMFASVNYPVDSTTARRDLPELLFRVRHYSGGQNDEQVDAALYIAFGLDPIAFTGEGPNFDSTDRWQIFPDVLELDAGTSTVERLEHPRFHDPNAYVSGGTLVMHLPGSLWPTGSVLARRALGTAGPFEAMAKIAPAADGGPWALKGMVTGLRVDVNQFLVALSRWEAPDSSTTVICQDPAIYAGLKTLLCNYVDVALTGNDPRVPCNAVSGGSILDAVQTQFSDTLTAPADPFPDCAPGIHPETDSCGDPEPHFDAQVDADHDGSAGDDQADAHASAADL